MVFSKKSKKQTPPKCIINKVDDLLTIMTMLFIDMKILCMFLDTQKSLGQLLR